MRVKKRDLVALGKRGSSGDSLSLTGRWWRKVKVTRERETEEGPWVVDLLVGLGLE